MKVQLNINFKSLLVKSPTSVYGRTANIYVGTYSTYGEADNIYAGQIVYNEVQITYNEGQIVQIQVCYQPHKMVTQYF